MNFFIRIFVTFVYYSLKKLKSMTPGKFFTIFLFFFLTAFNVNAQHEFTWEEYGISFSLPDDFSETENSSEQFSASREGMQFSIRPFKDDSIDDEDISEYTNAIAESMNLENLTVVSALEFNGFEGGYAEGVKDGVKVFVMGLIDPDSDTNFFVTIAFGENDEIATADAIKICQSIHKM